MTIPTEPPADDQQPAAPSEVVSATLVDEPTQVPGYTRLAWCAIVAVTSLIVIGMQIRPAPEVDEKADVEKTSTVDDLMQIGVELQGKVAVTFGELARNNPAAGAQAQQDQYAQMKQSLDKGPPSARLRFVVLAGELAGPDEALARLEQLHKDAQESDKQLSDNDAETAELLQQLYQGYKRDPRRPKTRAGADRATARATRLVWPSGDSAPGRTR